MLVDLFKASFPKRGGLRRVNAGEGSLTSGRNAERTAPRRGGNLKTEKNKNEKQMGVGGGGDEMCIKSRGMIKKEG